MKSYILPLMAATLLFSCSGSPKTEQQKTELATSEQLIGEWRNTCMKVVMPTYNNSDSTHVIEVTETNWEEKLKIKTIRTFFKPDGTYHSEHRNLKDSIVYNPAGKWHITGDSIMMTDTFPQAGINYKYRLVIKGTTAEFSGTEDFDQDGKKDDRYTGTQRKQK